MNKKKFFVRYLRGGDGDTLYYARVYMATCIGEFGAMLDDVRFDEIVHQVSTDMCLEHKWKRIGGDWTYVKEALHVDPFSLARARKDMIDMLEELNAPKSVSDNQITAECR